MADKVTTSSHRSITVTGTHLSPVRSASRENTSRTGAHQAPKGVPTNRTGAFTATRLSTGITAALGISQSGLHEAVKPEKPAKPKMSAAKKRRIYFITVLLTAIMIIAAAFTLNSTTKAAKYNNYLELAVSQYETGEYDAALTNLRKAASISKNEEIYILMANCYAQQQNYDKAIEVLRSLNPSGKNVQTLIADYQSSKDALLAADMVDVCGMQFEPDTASVNADGMNLGNRLPEELTKLYGLTALSAKSNAISDISALANLGGLVTLDLSDNSISDISALSGLTALRNLSLDGNPVKDLSPLYGLTELTALSIKGVELSPEALAKLSSALPQCAIHTEPLDTESADITVGGVTFSHDVETINLSGLGISDISVLSACTSLREIILDDNNILDITPLMDIPCLEKLSVRGNLISDLRPLIALSSVKYLDVSDNEITSVVALGSLEGLTTLILNGNQIYDFSPVAKLSSLETLGLNSTGLTDEALTGLYSLNKLKYLDIEDNDISGEAYDALARNFRGCVINHSKLVYSVQFCGVSFRQDSTELELSGKGITDISAISNFELLTSVNLSCNNISNIYTLEYTKNPIEHLDLSSNNIEDATAVSSMHYLKYLDLSYNSINSVKPFIMMTQLEYLNLTGNKLSGEQIASLQAALPNCEIVF